MPADSMLRLTKRCGEVTVDPQASERGGVWPGPHGL